MHMCVYIYIVCMICIYICTYIYIYIYIYTYYVIRTLEIITVDCNTADSQLTLSCFLTGAS